MNDAPLWWFLVLIGPAVGSFLAVLGDRLPRGEDVIRARSACRACAAPISWRDKIPLVSWLALRGECRACGAPIPALLWQAEVMGLAVPVLVGQVADGQLHLLLGTGFLWCLLGLAVCDLMAFRLPDSLTGTLAMLGLALAWEDPGRDLIGAGLAAVAGVAAFWILRASYLAVRGREGLGLGDVKLMAGIGAGLGLSMLPVATLVAAISALGVAIIRRVIARDMQADQPIAFGAYLAGGAGLVWLFNQ